MSDAMGQYRDHLVKAEQKAQDDYDKSILSLSGGALAVSFAFVEKFLQPDRVGSRWLLLLAWMAWAASVAAVLASYFFSHRALRVAIDQCDQGGSPIPRKPGGRFAKATEVLNVMGGSLFIFGVALIAVFATLNLGATK